MDSPKAVRVYKYGCRPPTENQGVVRRQLRLAHDYYNALITLKRAEFAARAKVKEEGGDEQAVHERANLWARALREECGCYWGTYLLVEQSVDQAVRASLKNGDPPSHHPWRGVGRVGVQIQSTQPLTWAQACACTDTRLRIERLPDEGGVKDGSRRSGRRAIVWLRIGTEETGRKPIWAKWPVTIHRTPPNTALISWAWVQNKKIGPDERWFLVLTVKGEFPEDQKIDPERSGRVAIDLGWRVRPDGVRVGYWRDDSGRHGELLVDPVVSKKLRHVRKITGIRDTLFNVFRDALVIWLQQQNEDTMPEWIRRDLSKIPHWRSPDRCYRFARYWGRNRFPGDEGFYPTVEAWWKEDRRLSAWAAHERNRALGRRNETYRLASVDFARRYAEVVIEDFDLRRVVGRRGLAEDADDADKVKADAASSVRHTVAPGIFRQFLQEACRVRGVPVLEVDPAWTTIDCVACGTRIPWDPAPQVEHKCEVCGNLVDQDHQACINLLRRSAESSSPVEQNSQGALEPKKTSRGARLLAAKRRRITDGPTGSGGARAEDGTCAE